MLGAVIAEGFIAVEAEDANAGEADRQKRAESGQGAGRRAGGRRARAQAITDAADKKDWTGVRKELDGALDDVKKAMSKLNSEALSQLVSLGGWIRGTEALTAVVGKAYTKDGAELLHQPVLLDYFEKRLAGLKPKYKVESGRHQGDAKGRAGHPPADRAWRTTRTSPKNRSKEINTHHLRPHQIDQLKGAVNFESLFCETFCSSRSQSF